jgi:hypothetical protein
MRSTMRAAAAIAAVGVLLASVVTGAAAATPDRLTQPQLRRVLLTTPQIATASGTGFAAQSTGVACAWSPEISANVCYRTGLHSDAARSAGAPWVTRLNVLSFATAAEARRYVTTAGADRPQVLGTSANRVVAFDPRTTIGAGARTQTGPEASVFQRVGSSAIWAACADPSEAAGAGGLASCATSVAAAQARRLR